MIHYDRIDSLLSGFKVFVISILPIPCLLASRLQSSLATYAPQMPSASTPRRVSFEVSNSLSEVSEVSTDSLSLTFFDLVLLQCVFWRATYC